MKWSASVAVPCFTVTPDQVWICDWAAIAQSEWLQGVKMCHKAHGQHSIPDLVLLSHVPQVSSIITTKEPTASQSLLTIGKPFAAWDSFVIFFGGIKMKWTQRFFLFFFFLTFLVFHLAAFPESSFFGQVENSGDPWLKIGNSQNISYFDSVYLVMATTSTVGFGDVVVKTSLGRGFIIFFTLGSLVKNIFNKFSI